jgi:hypothetical protein
VDEICQCFFQRICGEEGNSPGVVLERGKRRFGLATVELSSNQWFSVRAIHGGSPVVFRVNTGPRHLNELPTPVTPLLGSGDGEKLS